VLFALLAASLIVAICGGIAEFITERDWFRVSGFSSVFEYRFAVSATLWVVSISLTGAALWLTMRRVDRGAAHLRESLLDRVTNGATPTSQSTVNSIDRSIKFPLIISGTMIVAPLLGDRWKEAVFAIHGWREPFAGPQVLGQSPTFYVFRLPLLQAISFWLLALMSVCLLSTIATCSLGGLLVRGKRSDTERRVLAANGKVIGLLTVPFIGFACALAICVWLAKFRMAYRADGLLVGVFDIDRQLKSPALSLLALSALAVAAAAFMSARRISKRRGESIALEVWDELLLPRIGVALWVVTAIVTLLIVPLAVRSSQGEIFTDESESVSDHIDATLMAYGLTSVLPTASVAVPNGPADGSANKSLIQKRPDPRSFVGEPDRSEVTADPSWLFTHDVDRQRESSYTVSKSDEVGVSLGGLVNRVSFAVRYARPSLMGADPSSTLIHHLSIVERARSVAPFLRFDTRPYVVIVRNKPVWVLDGYSTSSRFPGAQRFDSSAKRVAEDKPEIGGNVNYVRNSVKVVIDANTGSMRFYRIDIKDPVARTWARAFPQLFGSVNEMIADYPGLVEQLRYPSDLFAVQAMLFGRYGSRSPEMVVGTSGALVPAQLSGLQNESSTRVPYGFPGEAAPQMSTVAVLHSDVIDDRMNTLLVGRSVRGKATLFVERVAGQSPTEARVALRAAVRYKAVQAEAQAIKQVLFYGPTQPVPTDRYGLLFVQRLIIESTDKAVGRSETFVSSGQLVASGETGPLAMSRFLAAAAVPTTAPPTAPSVGDLNAQLAEAKKRLAEAEQNLQALQSRVSVLERSSGERSESEGSVDSVVVRSSGERSESEGSVDSVVVRSSGERSESEGSVDSVVERSSGERSESEGSVDSVVERSSSERSDSTRPSTRRP
jgi:hypothetical protein